MRRAGCVLVWAAALAMLLCLATAVRGAEMPTDIKARHQQMLYPVVRVSTGSTGGSGTILYSEDRGDGCQTYVLTNHHVVNSAIRVATEWSSLLQADRKKEFNEPVKVEVFDYEDGSRQDRCDSYRADIVAHDKQHDLALVKLRTTRKLEHVAEVLSETEQVAIFEDIWAVGCSLGHAPVVTEGIIDYLDDVIDRKVYWMGSAPIIYGNSGGAVFIQRGKGYYFIGVPSRVSVTFSQAVTHMGYFVPITRIRKWLENEHLSFLLDKNAKPSECFKQREELRRKAELKLLQEMTEKVPTRAP